MDHIKEGVNLRAYAQKDPLTEYKRESFNTFENMRVEVKKAIVENIFTVQLYTQEEMDWAIANEEEMWKYFVERDLLYSTDSQLDRKFLDPAPFSKFGLELDNESPGRLGRFVGWQIVRAFMGKNEVGLRQLLDMPADEILKESNYKPRK